MKIAENLINVFYKFYFLAYLKSYLLASFCLISFLITNQFNLYKNKLQ